MPNTKHFIPKQEKNVVTEEYFCLFNLLQSLYYIEPENYILFTPTTMLN